MLIVEGMDNSGKTTLCKRLKNDFPSLEYIHSPSKKSWEEMIAWVHWVLEPWRRSTIPIFYMCDRFPLISEAVYGPILRKLNRVDNTPEGEGAVVLFKISDPLIVYCRPSNERLFDWGGHIQMDGVKEHAYDLMKQYDSFMLHLIRSGWKVLFYDYTSTFAYNLIAAYVSRELRSQGIKGGEIGRR